MSDESKGLLIKYVIFTLFLIIGSILFFVGVLNGGANNDGDLIFSSFFIAGFMLSGVSILFIFSSLVFDF